MPIIDDRIVSMEFDNSEFDPNIKKSQKTLEEFEKSLDTKNFEKYADNLNKTDMSALEKTFTGLGNSLKIFENIAIGAFRNVGVKIENFVSSTLKKMTVDPLVQGWGSYAEKIGSVQTIMAATRNKFEEMADALERGDESVKNLTKSTGELYTATEIMGEQMSYVNKQLDELMSFTDETSASYQVMVNNIGKFTSQNIDLKTSVKAMEGIATWANLSGANAEQMSRAMYNLSQSLGVGRMLTRDWMSIENATMATVEFKEAAIETAVALNKLQKDANGVVRTLNGKSIVSVSNFRDTLSEDWFTSDVLLGALDRYGGFSQEIIALSKKTNKSVYDLLYHAINPMSEGTISASDAMKELGLEGDELSDTLTKLASKEYDLGRRAFEASYESKTLADAINYVGDAIKTGWIKTYEYIIGDYKEAKQFWTEFAEVLYTLFVEAGDLRNKILAIWKALGGRQDIYDGLMNIKEVVEGLVEIAKEVLGTFFPKFKEESDAINWVAAVLISLSRKFKDFTEKLKENEELVNIVTSATRIFGNVLRGLLEVARLIYIFLGPTVRFTKQLFINTVKLIKPISEGADAVSNFKSGIEALRVAFLVLGAVIAFPIKLLSNLLYWLRKLGDMTLPELWESIKTWAKNVWEAIKALFSRSLELGKNVIDGFKQGFSNGFKALGDFVKGLFTGLINIVKNVLGIHSPSTVFIAIGAFVIAGLIIGIASMSDKLRDTLENVIDIFTKFARGIAIIAVSILIGIAVFKLIKGFSDISSGIGNIFKSISGFFNSAGSALQSYVKQKFKAGIISAMGSTALMLAGSVAIIAASIIAIALIANDLKPEVMNKALLVVGTTVGIMIALISTLMILNKVLSKGSDTSEVAFGGKLFEKLGVNINKISTSGNSVATGMMSLAKTFITLSFSISILVASITAMATIMADNDISVGTMFALAGLLQVLVTVLGSMVGLTIFIQKMQIDPDSFKQLKKYMMLGIAMLLSLSLMLALLSALNVSWGAVGQMAVIAALIGVFSGILVLLSLALKKANIPIAVLGKLALIVGIAVTAILTLTVSLALLGPALGALTEGLKVFAPYLLAFKDQAKDLVKAMGWFILFSFMLSVTSIFLSVAFVNIGIGLSTLIPILLALMLMSVGIGKMFDSISNAFEMAIDNIVKTANKFLDNYDVLKKALDGLKELMSSDLLGPIFILTFLSKAILSLGIAGWIAAGGLMLLVGAVKLASLAINDLTKILKFFETITAKQVLGMISLSVGILSIGLAATLTAPGLVSLALSISLIAIAILALSGAAVILGTGIQAANAALDFLKERFIDLLALTVSFISVMAAFGISLILIGTGSIILAIGLILIAVATLALCINFGIALLLMLAFNAIMNKIKEDNPKLYDSLIDIVSAFTDMIKTIALLFKLLIPFVAFVEKVLERIPDDFIDSAINCIQGFIDGINKVQKLKNTIVDLASDIIGWFEKVLHINSPSKETERLGEELDNGLVEGAENNRQSVLDYFKNFAKSITSTFQKWFNIDTEIEANGRNIKISSEITDKWAMTPNPNTNPSDKDYYNDYYKKTAKGTDETNKSLKDIADTSNMTEEELREYMQNRIKSDTADKKAQEEMINRQDKTFLGALGNIGEDIKSIFGDVISGEKTIGEGFKALWESLKTHGGTFLGDKIDGIKDWLFGEGGILSGLSNFLKDPFEGLGLDKILEEIQNMNLDDAIKDLDFGEGNTPDLSNIGTSTSAGAGNRNENYIFTQNNYSPKALSRLEIYRQTKRQFNDFRVKEVLGR